MSRHFTKWEAAEVARLTRMAGEGLTLTEMAHGLGRSKKSVSAKCKSLKLTARPSRTSKQETIRVFAGSLAKHGDITLAALETGVSSQHGKNLFTQLRKDLGRQAR